MEDVWAEVAAITPGPWVHIGGDEAIGTSDADYAVFITWLQGVITAQGKTMIGWDEIGAVALEPPFVAQHWIDQDRASDAVDQGGMMISSPADRAYLDMVHDGNADYGQVWAGAIDVERAYSWTIAPRTIDSEAVMGLEGALWTEYIDSTERMDFMMWPRAIAYAELGWSPVEVQGWEGFKERLGHHGPRLDAMDVGYYRTREIVWAE